MRSARSCRSSQNTVAATGRILGRERTTRPGCPQYYDCNSFRICHRGPVEVAYQRRRKTAPRVVRISADSPRDSSYIQRTGRGSFQRLHARYRFQPGTRWQDLSLFAKGLTRRGTQEEIRIGLRNGDLGLLPAVVTTPVTDWSFTEAVQTIQIETRTLYLIPHFVRTFIVSSIPIIGNCSVGHRVAAPRITGLALCAQPVEAQMKAAT